MKKSLFLMLAGILLFLLSCSKEEVRPLLNPQTELGDSCFYSSDYELQWNGEALGGKDSWAHPKVKFTTINSDSTKLKLIISSLNADEIDLVVDVVPGVSEITFSGKSSRKPYDLEVEGRFVPDDKGKKLFLNCHYQINDFSIEVDTPYDFRFGEDCFSLFVWRGGDIEWNGNTWEKSELVRDVLRKIGQRVAQHTEMMRVIFHADASLDILVKRVGESDFVRFATLKYDISGKYQNRMDWIFTKEQARYVETELIGEPPVCAVLLAGFFLDGRYFLPMFFKRGASPGELYLNIANPYRLIAVSRYVQTKGVEGLSEKDTEEMQLFFQIIQENDAWQKDTEWLYLLCTEKR